MDLAIKTTTRFVEDRAWLRNPLLATTQGATLDVSELTEADHFPDGYMPSGMVIGIITGSGLAADYLDGEVDGTEVAVGLLFSSVVIDATNLDDVGIAIMDTGHIISANLPTQGGVTDGGWDAAAAVDLAGAIFDQL